MYVKLIFANPKQNFCTSISDMTADDIKKDLIGASFDFSFKKQGIGVCVDVIITQSDKSERKEIPFWKWTFRNVSANELKAGDKFLFYDSNVPEFIFFELKDEKIFCAQVSNPNYKLSFNCSENSILHQISNKYE